MNNNILTLVICSLATAGLVSCVAPPSPTFAGAKSGVPGHVPAGSGQTYDWGPFGTGERDEVYVVPHHDPRLRGRPGDDRVIHHDDRGGGGADIEVLRRASDDRAEIREVR